MGVPAGQYSLRGESASYGWIDKKAIAVTAAVPLNFEVNSLVAAAGTAFAKAIGVDLPRGSEVRFARLSGVKIAKIVGLDRKNGFRVDGLLPGVYKVTLRPVIQGYGYVILPSQHNLRVDQGEIEIGGAGRKGIELRKPK